MKTDVLTAQQQRARRLHAAMVSLNLQAQLRLLVDDILSGDVSKIPELHYWLRFASPEINERLQTFVDQR